MAASPAPDIPNCRDLSVMGERVGRTLYTAFDDQLGHPVAITVYPVLPDGAAVEHFAQAADMAKRLGAHPSLLTVHGWGICDDGRPWVSTDAFAAEDADQLLRSRGPLDLAQALQTGVLLAGAVETAHRSGVVHGDIGPERVVFGANGQPLLAETGLTQFATLSGLGAVMAPIRYHAPPEVLEGTATSPATDVYALASTIYALVVGAAPHEKPANITDSNASLLLRILQVPVPPIEWPGVPAGLDETLRAAMSPEARYRPQQAIELAWALQDVQRLAGFGATEPVVIDAGDLDRLAPSRTPASTTSLTPSATGPASPVVAPPPPDHWGSAGNAGPVPPADEAPIFPELVDVAASPAPEPFDADPPAPDQPDLPGLPAWFTDPLPNAPMSEPPRPDTINGESVPPTTPGDAPGAWLESSVPEALPPRHGPGGAAGPGSDGSPWVAGWSLAPATSEDDSAAESGVNGHHSADPVEAAVDPDHLAQPAPADRFGAPGDTLPQRRTATGPAAPTDMPPGTPPASQPRLPRRNEMRGGRPADPAAPPIGGGTAADRAPSLADGPGSPGSALARAREARAERQRAEAESAASGGRPLAAARKLPQVAAEEARAPASTGASAARPKSPAALPVIVLVGVLVLLFAVAIWVIAKGDEPEPPANESISKDQADIAAESPVTPRAPAPGDGTVDSPSVVPNRGTAGVEQPGGDTLTP